MARVPVGAIRSEIRAPLIYGQIAISYGTGTSRVAQWRASQVTVKEPDYVSTEPPIIRTAGFPRSGWKSRYSASAFPVPPEPNSGRRLVCARLP